MARCSKKYLNGMLDAYTEELQDIAKDIQKNLEDMDFANAKTREDMQLVVDEIKLNCGSIKSMVENNKK